MRPVTSSTLSRGLPLATVAGMEVCWLLTGLQLLQIETTPAFFPIPRLMGFYALAFLFHHLFRIRIRIVLLRKAAMWLLWVLMFILTAFDLPQTIPEPGLSGWMFSLCRGLFPWPPMATPELLSLALSGILWFLGMRLSQLRIDFSTIATSFQFGLTIFLILAFLGGQWGGMPSFFAYGAPAFFFFGLLGMSLSHSGDGFWTVGAQRINWLMLLFFATLLIVGLGLLLGSLLRPDLLKQAYHLLRQGWDMTIGLLWKFILYLLSLLPQPDPQSMDFPLQSPPAAPEPPKWVEIFRIPDSVRTIGRIIFSIIWLVLILSALWSIASGIVNWLGRKIRGYEDAEIAKISHGFRKDILRLFMGLLRCIVRIKRRLETLFLLRKKKRTLPPEVVTARQVYAQLLRWAASKGYPRHSAQTPREYLEILERWRPQAHWELAFITHQYVHARYGPSLPSEKVLQTMQHSLRQIKRCSPAAGRGHTATPNKGEPQHGQSEDEIDARNGKAARGL